MSDEIRDIGTRVECKKIGCRHTRDGHVFAFAIHPDDTPQELLQDPLGQRYMAVFVRLDDEDQPTPSKSAQEGMFAVKLAGTLCRDEKFQSWLCLADLSDGMDEEAAARGLREYLNITSRSELKTNREAREKLISLREEFVNDIRSGKV